MNSKLSKYVSYAEGVKSQTAERLGIYNKPTQEQLESMKRIAVLVFDPIREHIGGPLGVTSFFRSPKLNEAIGGSTRSQHCKGEAMDIDADMFGIGNNLVIFDYIREKLDFDQLIWEFGTNDMPAWIHVSYKSKENNRKNVLQAIRENGRTEYRLFDLY